MNRFRLLDLLFLIGSVALSFVLIVVFLTVLQINNIIVMVFLLLPALIGGLLTFKMNIYHNYFEFLRIHLRNMGETKNYKWIGYKDNDEES